MEETITLWKSPEKRQKHKHRFLYNMFVKQKVLLYMISILLGRAVILLHISPFAIAFLVAVWSVYQRHVMLVACFMIFGAWTYAPGHALYIASAAFIFITFSTLLKHRNNIKGLILILLLSHLLARTFTYSLAGPITIYNLLHAMTESVLAVLLLLIFMQSLPYLNWKRHQPVLKHEEITCLLILMASVLTGFLGWEIYDVSLAHVFSRYIVLVLAFVGGAAIGATGGVVTGLILSLAHVTHLYQMSLLAFAGLLGGLLQEGRRHGASLGLLVGSFLVGIYGDMQPLGATMIESLVAVLLFYSTSQTFLKKIGRLIPGTVAYSDEERQYLQKMRDITARRVSQYSNVFAALSKSFIQSAEASTTNTRLEDTDYFLSLVTEKTCQGCFMKKRCWQNRFDETYSLMTDMKAALVEQANIPSTLEERFANHCVKSKKVIEMMQHEAKLLTMNKHLQRQVVESKKIVADQLQGVSHVMDNFAAEIVKERRRHERQELQLIRTLKEMHLQLEQLNIYQLEKGHVDIEMSIVFYEYHGEGAKLIAPILSDILKETIIVMKEDISPYPHGVSVLTFGSAQRYAVETGVATAAKGGGLVSGDAHTLMEIGKGKFALAISDGMGNGLRAREESSETLRLLEQILRTGLSENVAIQSINSILALRTTDEVFATLDLAIFNLHNASLRCLKIGAIPSFIKRGEDIIQIEASNVPMGMIEYVEVEAVKTELKAGDLFIMMSDGVFDGPKQIANPDLWLKRKLQNLKTTEPQAVADLLMEEVIRSDHGKIADDMTVVVAKITHHQADWAAIPYGKVQQSKVAR